jgi:hypothetical protein
VYIGPHTDLNNTSSWPAPGPAHIQSRFTPNTPFMFHLQNKSSLMGFAPQTSSPSTPVASGSNWSGPGSESGFNVGYGGPARRVEVEDIEMCSDSPARPVPVKSQVEQPIPEKQIKVEEVQVKKEEEVQVKKEPLDVEPVKNVEVKVEERPIASGAVSRVRKKRQKERMGRRRGSWSDDEVRPFPTMSC